MSRQKWVKFGLIGVSGFILIFAGCAEGNEAGSATVTEDSGVSAAAVIARACIKTTAVQSYRFQVRGASFQGRVHISSIDKGEYLSPDQVREEHTWARSGPSTSMSLYYSECIFIGRKEYSREFCSDWSDEENEAKAGWRESQTPEPVTLGGFLPGSLWCADMLVQPMQLADEEISGVGCWHYRGRMDMEKWLSKMHPEYEAWDSEEEKAYIEWYKKMDATMELWIGRDDYLIRRMKVEQQNTPAHAKRDVNIPLEEDVFIFFGISEYYDFNEPITIEPPK